MKKVCVIVLLAATLLLSAACSQKNNSSDKNSSTSPLSGTSSSASDISGTSSSEASVSEEEKTSSDSSTAPAIEDATFENSKDYSSNPVSKFVDVSKITDKTKADVLDVIGSSALTIKAEGSFTIAQGISVSFSAQISKDGSSSCFNLSLGGRESVVLKNEKGTYSLDTAKKTASLIKSADASESATSAFYSNPASSQVLSYLASTFGQAPLTYVRNGEEEYKGASLSFEEYAVGDNSIKLYYDGHVLKYIVLDKKGVASTITVKELKAEADPSLLTIPSDYTITE